ncbi:MAG: hypothetical protein ACRC7O_18975 [Fimbriiglobus sp.]
MSAARYYRNRMEASRGCRRGDVYTCVGAVDELNRLQAVIDGMANRIKELTAEVAALDSADRDSTPLAPDEPSP